MSESMRMGVAEAADELSELGAAMRADKRFASWRMAHAHPWLLTIRHEDRFVLLAAEAGLAKAGAWLHPWATHLAEARAALIQIGTLVEAGQGEGPQRELVATLPHGIGLDALFVAVRTAFGLLDAQRRSEARGVAVDRYRYEIGELFSIAQAIAQERDIDKLLALILERCRFVTSADAGSVYVVEGDDPDLARRWLCFKFTQNDSVQFDASEFRIPVSERSMAGYAALHRCSLNIADVYRLPLTAPYGFDRSFDEKISYRTKSMLCTPLLSRMGDVIGVLQLINKKTDEPVPLPGGGGKPRDLAAVEGVADAVVAFDTRSEELMRMMASFAGVALENAMLYRENQQMLEGFVRASVEAIEQRDPTTSGHSRRVADMTIALAKAVQREDIGPYEGVVWSADDMRELEYASLLHDFGKIGVREQVLVKAKKLYPKDLELVRARFSLAARAAEVRMLKRKIAAIERGAAATDLRLLDDELAQRRESLASALALILDANEPTILSGGDYALIDEIAQQSYLDDNGVERPLLEASEVECLSVTRGSLTSGEFDEIRNHVVHTYEFLAAIPWGRKFRRVALIAGAHHERLDGTGYPRRLRGSEIPLQSKIMAVSDIFDALTAADRPYKKAVPVERAVDILKMDVDEGHIDGELVRIFIAASSWNVIDGLG